MVESKGTASRDVPPGLIIIRGALSPGYTRGFDSNTARPGLLSPKVALPTPRGTTAEQYTAAMTTGWPPPPHNVRSPG